MYEYDYRKNKHQQLRSNLNFINEKDDKKISKKEM